MEKDDEIKGEANSLDFGARMYDPRVGRWFAIDNKFIKYSGYSPYNYCINSPIANYDPDGEDVLPIHRKYNTKHPGEDSNLKYTETEGFVYERSKKAAELLMKTERGRKTISKYMKKDDVFGGYKATEDGILKDSKLYLVETNFETAGFLGRTSYSGTSNEGLSKIDLYIIENNIEKYSDNAKIKYLNKLKSIDTEIEFNPFLFENYDSENDNIINLTHTIGHELFLHAINKGIMAAISLNNSKLKPLSQFYTLELLERQTGSSGEIDHDLYISKNKDFKTKRFGTFKGILIGASLFKEFVNQLGKVSGNEKITKEIEKKHHEKYKN